MRQQRITIPVIGGAAGYIIPDFEKGLGGFAEDALSISTTNYDLAPALTDPFRKRFGFFMVNEAIGSAVTSRRACAGDRESKIGKAESSDRSPEWRAL